MCHQSVGLIARHLEEAGYPTIGFTSARTITASANQPRSVLLDLPLGHTTGLPHDADGQRQILSQGLVGGMALTEPGSFHELPFRYIDDAWKAEPLSWSRKRQNRSTAKGGAAKPSSKGGDTRTGRSDQPVWQTPDDAKAAAAVSWDDQCLVCVGLPQPT